MKPTLIAVIVLANACAACSTGTKPTPSATASSSLPPGIVATVGSLAVPEEAIVSVAKAQQISPHQAADSEVRDALFAAAALQLGYAETTEVRAALRGRLARARLETLQHLAAATSITDAEVQEATARHFVELDRPEAFRVIHAVVLVGEKANAGERAKARALAERVAERVAPAADADEFKTRAESIDDRAGLELRVESLKPVAADGRVVDVEHPSSQEHYSPAFARAAARLTQPGQKSGIVTTEFGFHVMMLVEQTPPYAIALEERRRMLSDEIITERAKRLKKDLIEQLRSASPPLVERAADTIVSMVTIDDEAP